jgi:CxxC motif-containing protein (DUF1111 family)
LRLTRLIEAALEEFTGPEGPSDGLGPVFNAVGCAECHSTPIIGGSSQVTERRAGHWNDSTFTEHPGEPAVPFGGRLLQRDGISTPMLPLEQLSNGRALPAGTDPFPGEPGATDDTSNEDLELFTDFMRATEAPPRDTVIAATADSRRGEQLFAAVGCVGCHTPMIVTAPAGTVINGGAFTVPAALGIKIIHPFSDFLLHDIGTGDGIVQNGGPQTCNRMRTVPLWGLRARGRFMHDAASQSFDQAIARHAGQAAAALATYNALTVADRNRVLLFLSSL